MEEKIHYNIKKDCIRYFLDIHSDVFDNTIPNEKEIFKMFAESILNNIDRSVSGWEYEIDYDGFIDDLYYETYKPFIKPILTNNKELCNQLINIKSKQTPQYIVINND